MKRSYAWVFTINNHTFDDLDRLLEGSYQYLVFGFEVGEQGTPHIQGYVMYYTRKSRRAVSKDIPRGRLEAARGTAEQNFDYCNKEGDYYEFGERPRQGRASMERIEAAMLDPESNPALYMQYRKTYEFIKQHRIKSLNVNTKYYCIEPRYDAIQEIYEHFGWENDPQDDVVILPSWSEITQYENPSVIIVNEEWDTIQKFNLFPRGMQISAKYGYEWKVYKPDKFIVITNDTDKYPLYKNII